MQVRSAITVCVGDSLSTSDFLADRNARVGLCAGQLQQWQHQGRSQRTVTDRRGRRLGLVPIQPQAARKAMQAHRGGVG
jgi:hypothetical protein